MATALMQFPHYIHIFGLHLHPHPLMEAIAYAAGFQLYRMTRRYWPGAALPFESQVWILVAAGAGALVGSKMLAWVEAGPVFWNLWRDPRALASGKTIVGGLLGGWAGVEIVKRLLGVRQSTGDAFVFPLALGMAIGRIGCFLTGLSDHTCGLPTRMPWGVDFGDHQPRHPAQLYDIVFLLLLSPGLLWVAHRPGAAAPSGLLFRAFVFAYLVYRFAVEFIKPRYTLFGGMSAIQIACLGGAAATLFSIHGLVIRNRQDLASIDRQCV